ISPTKVGKAHRQAQHRPGRGWWAVPTLQRLWTGTLRKRPRHANHIGPWTRVYVHITAYPNTTIEDDFVVPRARAYGEIINYSEGPERDCIVPGARCDLQIVLGYVVVPIIDGNLVVASSHIDYNV